MRKVKFKFTSKNAWILLFHMRVPNMSCLAAYRRMGLIALHMCNREAPRTPRMRERPSPATEPDNLCIVNQDHAGRPADACAKDSRPQLAPIASLNLARSSRCASGHELAWFVMTPHSPNPPVREILASIVLGSRSRGKACANMLPVAVERGRLRSKLVRLQSGRRNVGLFYKRAAIVMNDRQASRVITA